MQKRLLTNHDQAYLEECARCKVSYLEKQKLTGEQQLTARQNIGISDEAIQQSIDTALTAAKESGEFDGYTPVKGVDYFDGEPGKQGDKGDPGKDGYTPVKGIDYFDGKDGRTPVKGIDYFDGAPGKDGSPGAKGDPGYTPKKGVDYVDGKDGIDGHTPVRGVDYWTAADKAEMVGEVLAAIPVGDEVAY